MGLFNKDEAAKFLADTNDRALLKKFEVEISELAKQLLIHTNLTAEESLDDAEDFIRAREERRK
jgi:hypothetical protein